MPKSDKITAETPELSVVLASLDGFKSIRKTIKALTNQTLRDELEVVIVAARDSDLREDQPEWRPFRAVRLVAVDRIESVAKANAAGVRAANAPLVALAEDHAFPAVDWADALIQAHKKDWAAVGPVVRNANPGTAVSWADFLIGYGPWLDPTPAGPVEFLPGHNSCYKRAVLMQHDKELEEMLEAETVLHWRLRSLGHQLYLEPKAKLAHTNFSLFSSWTRAQYYCGRVFAGTRIVNMSRLQRLIYFGGSPLIPFVRLFRILQQAQRSTSRELRMSRVVPVLLLGLVLDGIGQMLGYAMGAGASKQKLGHYEFHRFKHVTKKDRKALLS